MAALEAELAELKAENTKLDTDLGAAMEKTRSLEAESTQLRAARAITGTRLEPSATPAPAEDEGTPKPEGGFLTKMFKDPGMRKLLAAQQEAALRTLYSDFLKQVNLDPEETDRFFQLLQERQMALMDSSAGAMSGGEVDLKAATAAANATDDALRDLLGPGRFSQYQAFEKTLGPRMQVQQFNRQLTANSDPLDDSQIAAMIGIMSQEGASMPALGSGAEPGGVDQYSQRLAAVNQRIYNRAMSVLTPAQLNEFGLFQKNLEATQIASLKMAQQMLKGGP